jgi:hypothetical protein
MAFLRKFVKGNVFGNLNSKNFVSLENFQKCHFLGENCNDPKLVWIQKLYWWIHYMKKQNKLYQSYKNYINIW